MQAYLLVGAGGAIGAMLRYFVGDAASGARRSRYATMLINITGSLAMGLLIGILARTLPPMQEEIRLFVAVGILGGFTTFCAFSLDAVTLLERGDFTGAGLYVVDLGRCLDPRAVRGSHPHEDRRMSGVRQQVVARDEDGMRLDRWFATHFPQVDVRPPAEAPPLRPGPRRQRPGQDQHAARLGAGGPHPAGRRARREAPPAARTRKDAQFLRELILYEDDDLYVFNKPHGLASQGGSGTKRHMDGLLKSLANKKGEAPRLVHRLDRDTSGCLVVAKTKAAATHFGKVFSSRSARKIYWAVVVGNPHPQQGSISCFLAKQATTDGEQMVVVPNGTPGAQHSMSYYSTTDTAARRFAWVTLKPVTGRTHQLRVHMAQLGNPIIGDPRYFNIENWEAPEGLGDGPPSPRPPHRPAAAAAATGSTSRRRCRRIWLQTFDALGFDAERFDVQDVDPEERLITTDCERGNDPRRRAFTR